MTSSHKQILRSTSIMGAASLINILTRIVRVKVLAVLLGPAGIGLMGLYTSMLSVASNFAGLGVGVSAVRQIAEARGKEDKYKLGQVIQALRIATTFLGLSGMAVVFYFREKIAIATFGDVARAIDVGLLSFIVFVSVVASSIGAILQGYRRIGDQARVSVITGVAGAMIAVIFVLLYGEQGIIFFMMLTPVVGLAISWKYARRIPIQRVSFDVASVRYQISFMIKFGFMVMIAGSLIGWGTLFLLTKITKEYGLETTGIFQAAWAISFIYMSFLFDAMGVDYYPRLTEVANDNRAVNKLVNEQQYAALVLGAPLIIATMAFAPIIVKLLYAERFMAAVPIVQLMVFGNLLKLVGWPMGFVVMAKGKGIVFLLTQIDWVVLFLMISLFAMNDFGVLGVGFAFSAAYLIHVGFVYFVVHRLSGVVVQAKNLIVTVVVGVTCALLFIASQYSFYVFYGLGLLAFIVTSVFSYRELSLMLGQSPYRLLRKKMIGS